MQDLETARIAVVGLGYVGLPLAVEFGRKRAVVGFDINEARVCELRQGNDRTLEVSDAELASASGLTFTAEATGIAKCTVFIVTTPTPIDEFKRPDLSPVLSYESTVYPGATEEDCVPMLEARLRPALQRGLLRRLQPGTHQSRRQAASRDQHPQGHVRLHAGRRRFRRCAVRQHHHRRHPQGPSIKVAEAAKVIENTQRDLNIALVNDLAILFNKLGIDTLDVLEAAGTKWNFLPFRPGLVGGHCIGVDPYYLTHKARRSAITRR
jgi:UDP-N-acetyl-D-galactosamine dehydrogenase